MIFSKSGNNSVYFFALINMRLINRYIIGILADE